MVQNSSILDAATLKEKEQFLHILVNFKEDDSQKSFSLPVGVSGGGELLDIDDVVLLLSRSVHSLKLDLLIFLKFVFRIVIGKIEVPTSRIII